MSGSNAVPAADSSNPQQVRKPKPPPRGQGDAPAGVAMLDCWGISDGLNFDLFVEKNNEMWAVRRPKDTPKSPDANDHGVRSISDLLHEDDS